MVFYLLFITKVVCAIIYLNVFGDDGVVLLNFLQILFIACWYLKNDHFSVPFCTVGSKWLHQCRAESNSTLRNDWMRKKTVANFQLSVAPPKATITTMWRSARIRQMRENNWRKQREDLNELCIPCPTTTTLVGCFRNWLAAGRKTRWR